ncbi:MAG: alpha/beta fold hydrolase [Candidatus Competibacteraceae bacterium]|nr:alpha/beta fold hydrolase [Candidatus Competibacteraceae bacterium]
MNDTTVNEASNDHPDSRTRPALTRPADFMDFWGATLATLEAIDPEPRLYGGHCETSQLCLEELTFPSLDGAIIHGYLLSWRDDRPRPLVVHAHGYGSQYHIMEHWARNDGVDVVGFDARGFGRSRGAVAELSPHGYVLTAIESPHTSILRGAVCDYLQAYRMAHRRLGARAPRTIFCGTSFAGGLAVMAAAISHAADLLAVGVPTFGWAQGRRRLARQGSGAEINTYLATHPWAESQVMETLRYFDTMNFADLVRCPSLVGVGRRDKVVPAATVYAIANHMTCFHEVREFPVSHSLEPEEILWQAFEEEWLGLLKHGIATGFGTRRVRRIS